MTDIRVRYALCWLALAAIPTGCTKRTSVTEIDIASSGIQISDAPDAVVAWGGFRGPSRDGHVTDADVVTTWSKTENLLWTADVPGRGHGSPIVVGETILLPTAVESDSTQSIYAYSRTNGELLWNTVIHQGGFPSERENHQKSTNANSTLASDGQRIYAAFFNSGKVFATACDLAGEILWQKEIGAFNSKFGYAPSPIVYKSFVIVTGDNQGGGYIAALDGRTGEIAWRIARPAQNSHSTPAIYRVGGKEQLVISGCDAVCSYAPATGALLWKSNCTSETTCGTMVRNGDRLYASGGFPDRQTVCLDAAGNILWENKTKIYEPSMISVASSTYAVSDDGIAYCWDAASGKMNWRERLGGSFSSSPWTCNGNIYASNLDGKTFVFAANPDRYAEVSVNQLGTDCYATPAVVDGVIYTRIGFSTNGKRVERLCAIGK